MENAESGYDDFHLLFSILYPLSVAPMPLPDLIEIVPLDKPVRAEITVPGSKSITNRALILAALADGEVTLTGALWSEDTQVMTEALQELGFQIKVETDPEEFCNRTDHGQGTGRKSSERRNGGKTARTFCRQRGHGGAVSGGVRLLGQRCLSVARRAANARAPAGGFVQGIARVGLSGRNGKRK